MNRYLDVRTKQGRSAWVIIVFTAFVIGVMTFQAVRYKRNRPIMLAEAAAADAEGEARFDALGIPPGGSVKGPGEKTAPVKAPGAPRKRITWRKEFEVPGNADAAQEWYRNQLQGAGWTEFVHHQPSDLVREYRKDKWRVRISTGAWYDHPRRVRAAVELEWYYWQ